MPVDERGRPLVADVPGAYERIKTEATEIARRLNVVKEVIFGYFNETGHYPMNVQELEAWGSKPDPNYGIVRRQPNGAWNPITQGMLTPGKTDLDRGGFRQGNDTGHRINNAEDSDIQRYQRVEPDGSVPAGSWDPAWNAAHAEELKQYKNGFEASVDGLAKSITQRNSGQPASTGGGVTAPAAGSGTGAGPATGGMFGQVIDAYWNKIMGQSGGTPTVQGQAAVTAPTSRSAGPVARTMGAMEASNQMDANNYVGPEGDGFVSVVDGNKMQFFGPNAQQQAEQDFNTRKGLAGGGAAPPAAPPAASPGPAPGPMPSPTTGASPSAPSWNPAQQQLQVQAAWNDAQITYMNEKMRLIDLPYSQAQIEQMALQAAHQAVADGLAQQKYLNVDLPMIKLQQDTLAQRKSEFSQTFGLEQQTQASDATLRGAQIAGNEAIQRSQIGTSALQGAEQLGLGRQDAAIQGFLGAEAQANAARGIAQQGFQGAEQLARGADDFALQGANALNDTALRAIALDAQYRGPRNAWVQQQVNRGLNAAGLTSDVGAIAGEYDPSTFQAPQAQAEAASLGTGAYDMLAAGGGGAPGTTADGQLSPNEIIRRQVAARTANPYGYGGMRMMQDADQLSQNPYGTGGLSALQVAQGMAADPYGEYGRALGDEGLYQLDNQYGSPSAQAALQVAQQNVGYAGQGAPGVLLPGKGAEVQQGYYTLKNALGRAPTQEEVAGMIQKRTGLTAPQARTVAPMGLDYKAATGAELPPGDLDRRMIGAASSFPGAAFTAPRARRRNPLGVAA